MRLGTWLKTICVEWTAAWNRVRTSRSGRARRVNRDLVAQVELLETRWVLAAGSLDTSFGIGGKVTTAFGSCIDRVDAMTIDGNGRIVVVGRTDNGSNDDFAVARYNTDGSLDTSFDGDGKVTTAFGSSQDIASAVAIEGTKIVVVG